MNTLPYERTNLHKKKHDTNDKFSWKVAYLRHTEKQLRNKHHTEDWAHQSWTKILIQMTNFAGKYHSFLMYTVRFRFIGFIQENSFKTKTVPSTGH